MMGILFAKSRPSKITDQDKAILQLKQTRDKLRQYQKRIDQDIHHDKERAINMLKNNQKNRALLLLRKKKYQEQLLSKTDSQLENLEQMVYNLEFSEVQMKIIDGLKRGNDALRILQDLLSISDIEGVLNETRKSVEKQQEIDTLLSGVLSNEDEVEVEAELEVLMNENLEEITPQQLSYVLPDVPSTEPRISRESVHINSPQLL